MGSSKRLQVCQQKLEMGCFQSRSLFHLPDDEISSLCLNGVRLVVVLVVKVHLHIVHLHQTSQSTPNCWTPNIQI